MALGATAGALLLGVPAAFALARHEFPGRGAAAAALLSPLVFPVLITGVALLQMFATLSSNNTPLNMLIAHVLVTTPYVVRTVTASLILADTALEDAARTLGAGRWRVFRRITVPQIAPGLAAGALFAFMVSFDNFPISLWLADAQHNPVPLLIFQLIASVFDAVDRGDLDPDDRLRDGDRRSRWSGSSVCAARSRCSPFPDRQQETRMTQTHRRRAVLGGAAALAAPLIIGRRAGADDKSITVGIYTGAAGRCRAQADHPAVRGQAQLQGLYDAGRDPGADRADAQLAQQPEIQRHVHRRYRRRARQARGADREAAGRADPEHGAGAEALYLLRRLRRRIRDVGGGARLQHRDRQAARQLWRFMGPEACKGAS